MGSPARPSDSAVCAQARPGDQRRGSGAGGAGQPGGGSRRSARRSGPGGQ
ncbi:MAG: hypothetical protein N3B01_12485 [Verrucomicrobiae bacterium]|nr:hypothetical protein [Verrucomicrobiae bacterium]